MSTLEFDTEVMRQHRQDCIALRVPQSGDSVLDSLIREARRMEFAQAAMQGLLASATPYRDSCSISSDASIYADALLAALEPKP